MGTLITRTLTPEEVARTQAASTAMAGLGAGSATSAPKFVFVAAFDGTNNDRANRPLSGNPHQTNVANLFDQAEAAKATNPNLKTGYYPGVGTGGENGGLLSAAITPTQAVHHAAEMAVADFAKQAYVYLQENPGATAADLSASAIGFSRGTAAQIVFAQILNERGLVLPDGTVVAPPGVVVKGFGLMDPVHTFVDGDMRIPPNVQGDVLVVRALNEDRRDFAFVDYSADKRVTTVDVNGNHCGIGGGQDKTGTGAAVLEGMTGYLNNMGTTVGAVPPENKFVPGDKIPIRSEDFQLAANGDVLTHEDPITHEQVPTLVWRTNGTRPTVHLGEPAASGNSSGLDASDAHFKHHPPSDSGDHPTTPTGDTPPSDAGHLHNVDYHVTTYNGQTFEVREGGALTRELGNGHTEWRDPQTGEGYITTTDSQGQTVPVQKLAADDVVQTGWDDGQWRIAHGPNDTANTPPTDGSDHHLYSHPDTGTAPTESTQGATHSVVTPNDAPPDLGAATQNLSLISTLVGLKNWASQDGLGHLSTAVGLYNQLNTLGLSTAELSSGATNNLGLGSLGTLGSGLGLVSALQSGNPISIASSGASFANAIAGTNVIPVPVISALNIVGAVQSGNPLAVASSVAACFPPYGTVISLCISVFGSLLGNHSPPPPPDGVVSYHLDEHGAITIQTEHSVSGGADTAKGTAGSLLGILQSVIDGSTTKETVHADNIGQRLRAINTIAQQQSFTRANTLFNTKDPKNTLQRTPCAHAWQSSRTIRNRFTRSACAHNGQSRHSALHAMRSARKLEIFLRLVPYSKGFVPSSKHAIAPIRLA